MVRLIPGYLFPAACVQTIDTVKFQLGLTLAVLGSFACSARSLTPIASDVYARSITELGGRVVDSAGYPETVAGFQQYLTASGATSVTAAEMTRPNHPGVAAHFGFNDFLPPRSWWPRGVALALLTQAIEQRVHSAVHVRNWWRPAAYNADPAVGGAKAGDHPTANAVDLDYGSGSDRIIAEGFLRGLEARCPWMQLSLGLGAQTTHIGIGSPRGHREWHYAGWRPAPVRSKSRAS